jgi:hypothetical protein
MHVLQRHVLRSKPGIPAGQDRAKSVLKLLTASHVLTIDSEQQTSTWEFNQWYRVLY